MAPIKLRGPVVGTLLRRGPHGTWVRDLVSEVPAGVPSVNSCRGGPVAGRQVEPIDRGQPHACGPPGPGVARAMTDPTNDIARDVARDVALERKAQRATRTCPYCDEPLHLFGGIGTAAVHVAKCAGRPAEEASSGR